MKAVIFGAGASHDAFYEFDSPSSILNNSQSPNIEEVINYFKRVDSENFNFKLPLTKDLFKKHIRDHAKIVIDEMPDFNAFADSFNIKSNLENELDVLIDLIESNPENKLLKVKYVSVILYLQTLFLSMSTKYGQIGRSNYNVLLSDAINHSIIRAEEVIFISFNYDILFDTAFETYLGREIKHIDDYISKEMKLFKPHGSCNWIKHTSEDFLNPTLSSVNTFYSNPDILLKELANNDSEIVIDKSPNTYHPTNGNNYRFKIPQITIPIYKKDKFIMPDKHEKLLKEKLQEVTDVLIVGWRGTEKKFIETLEQNLKKVKRFNYIMGNQDSTHNLVPLFQRANHEFIKTAFKITSNDDRTYLVSQNTFSSYIRSSQLDSNYNFFR